MRTGRWQRVAAAWAVRSQPYPAVGAELPVRFELAAAIETLLEELVKFVMELEECGLHPALLGLLMLFLVVHCGPFVSHHYLIYGGPPRGSRRGWSPPAQEPCAPLLDMCAPLYLCARRDESA
jgi:hypothetical protein